MPTILWNVPVPPENTPKHDAATPVLHSWDETVKLPPFLIQISWWSLWPNSSILIPSDNRTCLQKIKVWVHLETVICLFNVAFGNGFFLLEQTFSPCWYRTGSTVDNDTQPASSQFVLLLLWSWFHAKARSSLGRSPYFLHQFPSVVWWLDIPMVFILNTLNVFINKQEPVWKNHRQPQQHDIL